MIRTPLILAILALALVAAAPALAQKNDAESLKRSIEQESKKVESQRSQIGVLTKQERELHGQLAASEKRVNALATEVAAAERELAAVEKRQQDILAEHGRIEKRRAELQKELAGIMETLWPLHLENTTNRLKGLDSWEDADRRFTWLAALYAAGSERMDELAERTSALATNLAEQDRVKAEAEKKLALVNTRKDQLLNEKLALSREIQKIRAEKLSQEEELKRILATVESLKYRLSLLTSRKIADHKGRLPWPADGAVAIRFNLNANPPVRGVGIRLAEGAPVKAVSWGTVVHDDVLRGFGKVIILFHGDNFYSLYAYLSHSNVRMGQDVEKDEVLGVAGPYPDLKGHGLYFELRRQEKAVNPFEWLSARK